MTWPVITPIIVYMYVCYGGVHEMHSRMHPDWDLAISLLAYDPLLSLAHPMIAHTPLVASALPIKTLVVRQWPTNIHVHAPICTWTYMHAYIVGSLPRWKVNSDLGLQKVQKEHITISQHTQHTQIQSSSYTVSWQWGQEEHWWALEGDSTSTDYNNSNWSYDCQNHSIQREARVGLTIFKQLHVL